MAKHEISMYQPPEDVIRSDVKFSIRRDGSKLGELHISKGNVEWWPKGNKKKKKRLTWLQFAALFEEHGREIQQ